MTRTIPRGADAGAVSSAFAALSDGDAVRFEAGTYRLRNEAGDSLFSALMRGKISPTDYDYWRDHPNRAASLSGRRDVTIDGGGAVLCFDGLIQPFYFEDCRDLVLKNITLDWGRPPYSFGTILASGKDGIVVRPAGGQALSGGEPVVSYQDFEPGGIRPLGNCVFEKTEPVVRLENGDLLLRGPESERYRPGDGLLFRHIYSYAPMIQLFGCRNVRLENVTISAGPGMGVIAHRCETITLRGLRVVPSRGRPMSVNCDATHFISCAGRIDVRDCTFEGMGDDAVNVHGFYLLVTGRPAPDRVKAVLPVTTQDFREEYPLPGEEVSFVDGGDLTPKLGGERFRVTEAVKEADGYLLTFDRPLPTAIGAGDQTVNVSLLASLSFRNCSVKNIRGRAVLIQTVNAEVSGCVFEACTGEGVHLNTAVGWAESCGTENVVIRGNRFIGCGYGTTKYCDAIGIAAGSECERKAPGVHRNVRITDNEFTGTGRAMLLTCCDGVTVSGNRFEGCREEIALSSSVNVSIGI